MGPTRFTSFDAPHVIIRRTRVCALTWRGNMNMAQWAPWTEGLTANHLNYEGIVEEERLGKILELHKYFWDTVQSWKDHKS